MWRVCLIGLILLTAVCASPSYARKWTSRSGEFSVEAELIDADAQTAVLKREDNGQLVRVPIAQLSLSDAHYIREAMQAADALPAEDAAATASPDAAAQATVQNPPTAAGTSPTAAIAPVGGPPLTEEGRSGWQAVPDPPRGDPAASPPEDVSIRIPSRYGSDKVAFAGPASPFVSVGSNDSQCVREMWDLTSQRRVGIIRDEIPGIQRAAISPDGRWLACTRSLARGKIIELWSFQSGKCEREIDLEQQFGSIYGLDFAGPDRLVVSVPHEKALIVWDVATGQRITKVDIYPTPMSNDYAISPGGSYLALVRNHDRIELRDLRNGAFAGDVNLRDSENGSSLNIQALSFSADGSEFAATGRRLNNWVLLCWSIKDGALVADHKLSEDLGFVSIPSSNARCDSIQWLPNGRGWVLLGVAVVDRELGGPVWLHKDRNMVRARLCRVLDENRLLVLAGDTSRESLETVQIPWDTIQEGQQIVQSGGSVDDIGLPPVTAADISGATSPPTDSVAYQPIETGQDAPREANNGLVLSNPIGLIQKSMLAAANRNLLLLGGSLPTMPSSLAEMTLRSTAPVSDVYDLKSPRHMFRFQTPFATELIDFSPSGSRGLFCESNDQTRLDVYDLESGQHVVAFRPFQNSENAFQRKVTWAAFADDEHVVTLGYDARLVLWKIPDVQAVYSLPASRGGKGYFDRGRNYLALPTTDGIRVTEPQTGRSCGLLTYVDKDSRSVSSAAFRQDGKRLAAWFRQPEGGRLVVWDLEAWTVAGDLKVPFDATALTWSGPEHILLHGTQSDQDMQRGKFKVTLIDVAAPRVAWHYHVDLFTFLTDTPDDRCWYFAADVGSRTRRLLAVELPDPKAQEILAATPPPPPAFGKGTQVALKINVGAMPDGLDDRREREDELIRNLTEHFTDAVGSAGATVARKAPVTLTATVKNLTEDDILVLRSRYRLRPDLTIVLTKSTVRAHVALETDDGTVLWSDEKLVGSRDVSEPANTAGLSLGTAIHLAQWQLARQWCLELPLPEVLYHPEAYRGVGESRLTTSEVQFLRTLNSP
jgi:WD40 repeat protein